MISQARVVTAARSWLDVPFQHQGRNKHGVDCAGFVVELMRSINVLPSDFREPTDYRRMPDGRLEELIAAQCIRSGVVEIASLILIKWPKHRHPGHVGICTGPKIIHAYELAGKVVENGYRGHWVRDTHSVYRLPGVTYV
jgi:cell wall-associated NlpC family hydrolase